MKLSTKTSKYDSNLPEDAPTKQASILADPFIIYTSIAQLYSDPILATVRETLSNAIDANDEALDREDVPIGWDKDLLGKPIYKPVEITLPTSLDPTLTIKDYGIGLSEQGVLDNVTTIGLSDKRGSNRRTGGFGRGMKAPMAITSQFLVIRRGENPEKPGEYSETTFEVSANPMTGFQCRQFPIRKSVVDGQGNPKEDRGITVSIPIENSKIYAICEAVQKCVRWHNDGKYVITNGKKETEFKEVISFSANLGGKDRVFCRCGNWRHTGSSNQYNWEKSGKFYAVMAGVCYPIPENILGSNLVNPYQFSDLGSIYFYFPSGALSMIPSREALYEDDLTKKSVHKFLSLLCGKTHEYLEGQMKLIGDSLWDYLSEKKSSWSTSKGSIINDLIALETNIHRHLNLPWKLNEQHSTLIEDHMTLSLKDLQETVQEVDNKGVPIFDWRGDPILRLKRHLAKLTCFDEYSLNYQNRNKFQEIKSGSYFAPRRYQPFIFWRTSDVKKPKARVKTYYEENKIEISQSQYHSPSVIVITVDDSEGEKKTKEYLNRAIEALGNPSNLINLADYEPWKPAQITSGSSQAVVSPRNSAYIYYNDGSSWNKTTEWPILSDSKKFKTTPKSAFYVMIKNYQPYFETPPVVLKDELFEINGELGEPYTFSTFHALDRFWSVLYRVSELNPHRFPLILVPYSRRGQFKKHLKDTNQCWINAIDYLEDRIPKWIKEKLRVEQRWQKLGLYTCDMDTVSQRIPYGVKSEWCEEVKKWCYSWRHLRTELDIRRGLCDIPYVVKDGWVPKDLVKGFKPRTTPLTHYLYSRYPALNSLGGGEEGRRYIEDMDELLRYRGTTRIGNGIFPMNSPQYNRDYT